MAFCVKRAIFSPGSAAASTSSIGSRIAFPSALPQAPLPPSPPASGSEDAFPFGVLAKTMRRVLSDYGQRILMKPPNSGCPQLREAICRYLARSRGIIVEPRQVVIGSGAEYLYSLIVQLLGKDRIYAWSAPVIDKIRRVYLANGASCDMLRMGAGWYPQRRACPNASHGAACYSL